MLVIVNINARKGGIDQAAIREVLEKTGIRASVHFCEDTSQARKAIARHRREADCIVVGGGDGTLNALAEDLLASGLPLGLLPLGTANDLAQTLQIPTQLEAAAQVLANGRPTRIDMGKVNGKYYFNVANIGLGFHITRTLTSSKKKRWGVMAYPLSLFEAYAANKPFRAQIDCDGDTRRLASIQIAVGNGRHYGGIMTVHEDAAIDDHLLDLYSLAPQSIGDLLRAAPAIVKGAYGGQQQVRMMQGERIDVSTDRSLPISTDGETTTRTPASFTVEKDALVVIVPSDPSKGGNNHEQNRSDHHGHV